jgi:hypothetical protein
MPQILLTGQLKEKPTYRLWYLYRSFVHGGVVRHPIPPRFLAPIDCSKIPALDESWQISIWFGKQMALPMPIFLLPPSPLSRGTSPLPPSLGGGGEVRKPCHLWCVGRPDGKGTTIDRATHIDTV